MERSTPNNIEAEQGLLGSILLDPEVIALVIDVIKPDDFYRDAHKEIYRAIVSLYSRREPADYISICDHLEAKGQLENVGGAYYITGLIDDVPTSGNAEYYAEIIKKKAIWRRLISAAGKIAAAGYEENPNALDLAEHLIYEVSESTASSDLVPLSEVMTEFLTDLDRRQSPAGQVVGIPTGFFDLDFKLGGLQPQELIILGGRPGEGKTSLLLNIICNVIFKSKRKVAFFSLEMSRKDIARRLVSMQTGIDSQQLRTRMLDDQEMNRVVNAATEELYNDMAYIDESGDLSIASIRSKSRRHKAKHGLDLIVVDYLQLMHADVEDHKQHYERRQEIDKISRSLKQLSKELDVPVLACASLSRAPEQRADPTPRLSDLRESGSIESDADIVMFIRRSTEQAGRSLINIEKHRNGAEGDVTLRFIPELTKFEDLEV